MKVLFVAAEVAPLAKVGGLADVASGLPRELRALGHDVRLIVPRYAGIGPPAVEPRSTDVVFDLPTDRGMETCRLYEADLGGVPLYLVEQERLLSRHRVYGYSDDLDRFVYFAGAALEATRRLAWQPDLVHVHDWHSAIVPAWLHLTMRDDPFFASIASVLTIHNLTFQGWFDQGFRNRFDLVPAEAIAEPIDGVDLHSTLSLGILHADQVNTVSDTYAREILTPAYGARLDPLLRHRRAQLRGIVNGIDVAAFDPRHDPQIAATYSAETLDRKAIDKCVLQEESGLPVEPDTLLVTSVSRLTDQKGFDLIADTLPLLLEEARMQFVLLGTGDERYERLFADLSRRFPAQVTACLSFDAAVAQRLYAGADLFLMPSRFEPCGLGQLIALRYGTVPLVRRTGGLADTVQDIDESGTDGTGFVFTEYEPEALRLALLRALATYQRPDAWKALVMRGMQRDVSWSEPAKRYVQLYHDAIAHHRAERS